MAYDNSSLTGDEICDYYYDIENNFMNPPSPTGYFIYKVIGGAFDRLNDLVTQFRNDYSILDCNVGNVEIVKSFPEEADTNHTYYVHQYNTSTDACFTKYSYVDGEWVSETVTGDVLNSLDVFWGRSYNLPRPLLYEGQKADYLFIDNGTTASHYDHWYINSYGTATVQSDGTKLLNTSGNTSFVMRSIIPSNKAISDANAYSYNPPYIVEFDIVETNGTSDNNAQVQIYSQQTTNNFAQAVTTGHYKIKVTSEEQKIWLNDTLIKTTNLSLLNARITLRVRNSKYLIYKNFKVYKGEEKERPLNDDEYRIYLYLKNHQLLTMKDLLVALGNAFGSAETSATILNSIHTVDHKTYDNPPFSNDSLRAYDDEDMDITTDKLVDKDGVNLINNRLAQGTTSILIPDDSWDEEYLRFLESFISIKGNILISTGG